MSLKDMRLTKQRKAKLRQLYNHANVLHNIAWEARYALNKEVDKIIFKCKTLAEAESARAKLDELLKFSAWPAPANPKPKRSSCHSGDMDILGFCGYHHISGLKNPPKKTT